MQARNFEVKLMPLGAVKLWEDNPRRNDESAEKLAELLKVHGVRTPIVVWKKNMVVYKGNTTLKACKLAGIKEVPVVLADFKNTADAVAYALADNKASEWSEWDDEILKRLLASKELIKLNVNKATGFTEKELAFAGLDAFKASVFNNADVAKLADDFRNKSKSKFWFWFEVPNEAVFTNIKQRFARTEGARLHRELDYGKLKGVFFSAPRKAAS